MSTKSAIGRVLVVIGIALIGASAACGITAGGDARALSGSYVAGTYQSARCGSLPVTIEGKWVCKVLPEVKSTGLRRVVREQSDGAAPQVGSEAEVVVLPRSAAYPAMVGIALLLLALPTALGLRRKDESGNELSTWKVLLSEKGPGGLGMSLGRVQLLLWFAPAIVIWGAISVATAQFAPLAGSVVVLLGLSGVTALLGSAATPPAGKPRLGPVPLTTFPDSGVAVDPPPSQPPSLSDLVKDWSEQGDLSRYQQLLIACVGAAVLIAGFMAQGHLPAIPEEILGLVVASQATYLGTKAVKTSRGEEKRAET